MKDPLTFPPHLKDQKQRAVLTDFLTRHADRRLGYNGVDQAPSQLASGALS